MTCGQCTNTEKCEFPEYLVCTVQQTKETTVYVKPSAEICENFKQGENRE